MANKLSSLSGVQKLRHRKEHKCRHSERYRKRWIQHVDCDARCDHAWTNFLMLPCTRQCPVKRRKRLCSTERHYSDPTLACVTCVNSWGSSLPRENILACKCKTSVHSHLGVCEDSLDGVSQLKFSMERRFSRTRYAFTHNEIHKTVDNSEIHTTFSSRK